MNKPVQRVVRSACPHDCPSACALDVEILDGRTIGRIRGARDDPYTDGVICEKVARYAERVHHPDRLLYPLKRVGGKGEGKWQRISWDEALDEIAARFLQIEAEDGPEAIWPYNYGGTMGYVQRDSLERLRNVRGYSRQKGTICIMSSWPGYIAGTGLLSGVDPVEMAYSDAVVIWGTNAVHTQVNAMTHALRAKKRGAPLVVIDIYRNATMQQADIGLLVRPGSDGALALAAMHVLLREGLADRDYLENFTDFDAEIAAHLKTWTPERASAITGLSVDEIEAFARLVGTHKATYFRIGYGFSRQRNGSTNIHAALSVPAMTGAWQHRGGGALLSNSGNWGLDMSLIQGAADTSARVLDMSEIGPILSGDRQALQGGTPVKALLIQNTNPVVVAPEQEKVRAGFLRENLFTVVHEQFMTDTAALADIVLPATMFVEHSDFYTRGGHTRIVLGPKAIAPPGEAKPNIFVINELARRLGSDPQPADTLSDRALMAETFARSGFGALEEIESAGYVERARPDDQAHFRDGFAWPDKRYHFRPDWHAVAELKHYAFVADPDEMPKLVEYWDVNEKPDAEHPFKLATSPARTFLNSTFTETPGSLAREKQPNLLIHPDDAVRLGIGDGDPVRVGNRRGEVELSARLFEGLRSGVVIAEGLFPNRAHRGGKGINSLTSSQPVKPFGGAAFHDSAVWIRPIP